MSQAIRARALADSHRRRQAVTATQVQRALGLAWDRTMRLDDLDRSFEVFYRTAETILGAGRRLSLQEAQRYYLGAARNAGLTLTGTALRLEAPALLPGRLETTLRVTGPVGVKQRLRDGRDSQTAMAMARAAVLGAGKRLVLEASREALIGQARREPRVEGWARMSDGDPCHFCAMLVARGPVYGSQEAANFPAHDGCGCEPQILFRGDGDGWSPQARRYAALWQETGEPNAFRRAIYEARNDPDSDAAAILRGGA